MKPSPEELLALAERCEKVRPDNELWLGHLAGALAKAFLPDGMADVHAANAIVHAKNAIHGDLNAAALVRHVLPGRDWHAGTHNGRGVCAVLTDDPIDWRQAATPALALCAAVLRAKAKEADDA